MLFRKVMYIMISIKELSFSYNNNSIFDNTYFHANVGYLTVIKGESGSGKTTLLDIMALKHGNVFNAYYNDAPIQEEDYLSQLYYMTQEPIFCDSLKLKEQWDILIKNYGYNPQLNHYISSLGLDDIQNLYPAQLSGGEKLRAALIQIFIIKPQIILMDEPTASLDDEYKNKFIELLHILKQNCHLIVSTHDSHIFNEADVLYEIKNKRLYLEKTSQDIINHTLESHHFKFKKVWLLDFLKMKRHHFIREMITLLFISIPISFFAYAYSIDSNFISQFKDNLASLANNHILVYKPIDKRFTSFTYYSNPDQATAFPISENEYHTITGIAGIKEIKPKIILPTYFYNTLDSTSIPEIKIYKNNEMIFDYQEKANELISMENYDYSQLYIESIQDYEIEKLATQIFNNKKNGIFISEIFLENNDLDENDIKDAYVKINIGVPEYDISGKYELAPTSNDNITINDEDMIPANKIQFALEELTLPIRGIIESPTTDLYTYDFYMLDEDLEAIANSHIASEGKTLYFKNSDTDWVEVENEEDAEIINIYTPWRPNAYTIEVDQIENVETVVDKLEDYGYAVDWQYNDYKLYGESIQITQSLIQKVSIISIIFITLIFIILHFIKGQQEEKLNIWLRSIGYHHKKTLLMIKSQKYLLNTIFISLFAYLLLWLINIYFLYVSSKLFAIDILVIFVMILIVLLTQFCIPLLWEVTHNVKTR